MSASERLRSFLLYRLPGLGLRSAILLLMLNLLGGVFEGMGAAMVLPILEYVSGPR